MKRGQINMSFGMIFSIILIIVFIAFAFYAIQKFLSLQGSISTKQFVDNLQNDVTTVWNSRESTQPETYNIPSSIARICFQQSKDVDMIFITKSNEAMAGGYIDHLNITATISSESGGCFNSTDNKINLILQKNFGDTLVTIR